LYPIVLYHSLSRRVNIIVYYRLGKLQYRLIDFRLLAFKWLISETLTQWTHIKYLSNFIDIFLDKRFHLTRRLASYQKNRYRYKWIRRTINDAKLVNGQDRKYPNDIGFPVSHFRENANSCWREIIILDILPQIREIRFSRKISVLQYCMHFPDFDSDTHVNWEPLIIN
jgi:hypothetical protein